MAITTEFLPYEANATALAIMKEFIYSYIDSSTLDVLDEFPVLDENFILYSSHNRKHNLLLGFGSGSESLNREPGYDALRKRESQRERAMVAQV